MEDGGKRVLGGGGRGRERWRDSRKLLMMTRVILRNNSRFSRELLIKLREGECNF